MYAYRQICELGAIVVKQKHQSDKTIITSK